MSSRRRDRSGIEPVSVISFAASFALPQADCALPATSLYAPLTSDVLSSVAAPTNLTRHARALTSEEINILLGRRQELEEFEQQMRVQEWSDKEWQDFFD